MREFFAMGGYAVYVWPSFLLALIVLVANVVAPMQQRKRVLKDIARKLRRARKEQR
ncbi:MAG: heme exporter protein CcmD [Candidatus Thiodiazotropha sp. (ex Lucina aurantia)]|uniref:Heme exporter protein D n=1 Tax=Candidatus Thiodiazotropha endolucinida TaxID=1655433 RepID=A0A7Z0VMB5_9GAMM|nr:heme exporter protein CcmD [Candidatus Thiodiazotropha endolucinida]MBT3014054.1 heme exporter protein CcmD [Candidatus Thiodiazotropha sp. (ex Lucina pensylvanica)]MBT3017568.1 heme exporter protein CcmD [Candidatus Thiodiazotropha taylori]MBT3042897.1 heme exporter protein CcmD [Candidatus Thiodiazotropha sp. (ex Codakia orbicularis)]MBV2103607.1 heme exporter protein CcmD [Candidatus Thiodiazotropha sp. (ex Lucina aurantia)]MBT3023545.1 heme exporter protein CcmD [Candidatus Thiodiazotro